MVKVILLKGWYKIMEKNIRLKDWKIEGEVAILTYTDNEVLKMTKQKFNQAFGAIISAPKSAIKNEFTEFLVD